MCNLRDIYIYFFFLSPCKNNAIWYTYDNVSICLKKGLSRVLLKCDTYMFVHVLKGAVVLPPPKIDSFTLKENIEWKWQTINGERLQMFKNVTQRCGPVGGLPVYQSSHGAGGRVTNADSGLRSHSFNLWKRILINIRRSDERLHWIRWRLSLEMFFCRIYNELNNGTYEDIGEYYV